MTNWTEENGGGWLRCPHCDPEMGQIYLPRAVRGDFPFRSETPARITERLLVEPGPQQSEDDIPF